MTSLHASCTPTAPNGIADEERLAHLARLDALLELPEFSDAPLAPAERDQRTYRRLAALMHHEGSAVALASSSARWCTVLEWAAVVDSSLFLAALVHAGVCTATVATLGRPGLYLTEVLRELDEHRASGAVLITEAGQGGSHLAPATEARFDPASRSFTLHTPDPTAAKLMANVAAPGITKTAIVYAELIVGEQQCGVFPFAVRIRTADGTGEGIRISRLPELPALPLDHALVFFDGTTVPYDGWLRDSAEITHDGRFVDPLGDPDRRLVRSLCFSANSSLSIAVGAASAARACVTAALRFAQHRTTAGRLAPGESVLSYRTQQTALYTALARVQATTFLVRLAESSRPDTAAAPRAGEPTSAPWAAVHHARAITKAGAVDTLEHVAATCRRYGGAHALLDVNRLVQYEGMAHACAKAGGDNLLIRMDAGKTLAEDPGYHPAAPDRPLHFDPEDAKTVRALAAIREARLCDELRDLASRNPKESSFETWNALLPHAMELADAHLLRLTLDAFDNAVHTTAEHAKPLRALQNLYGLDTLRDTLAWHLEHGTLTSRDAARVHTAHASAVERVHPQAPTLTEALGVPTARLRSLMNEPSYLTALDGTVNLSSSK